MSIELKKQPETEAEYWGIIENLGGFIFYTNHDLAHDRITGPTGELDKSIESARVLSKTLVQEVCEKFGVIHPSDYPKVEFGQNLPPSQEGKTYYWDWYKVQKRNFLEAEYNKLICSACPLSEGVDKFVSSGGRIPCIPFAGILNSLVAPDSCAMIDDMDWTKEQLYEKIVKKGGQKALRKFQVKEEALKK